MPSIRTRIPLWKWSNCRSKFSPIPHTDSLPGPGRHLKSIDPELPCELMALNCFFQRPGWPPTGRTATAAAETRRRQAHAPHPRACRVWAVGPTCTRLRVQFHGRIGVCDGGSACADQPGCTDSRLLLRMHAPKTV